MTSMTAFARNECSQSSGQLIWEIRTVNHRFLDIHLRLPDPLRHLETTCRQQITAALGRGRVDAVLKLEQSPTANSAIALNPQVLKAATKLFQQLKQHFPQIPSLTVSDLLALPGILQPAANDSDSLQQNALELLQQNLTDLTAMRRREGEKLVSMILQRITACRSWVDQLQSALSDIEDSIQQRWHKRLEAIEGEVDAVRLHQELAILLNKSDITEELDRLDTHLDEIKRVLENEQPAGRRLDFLMQELNREANTMSAKSADKRVTTTALELKVLIEQMREQVQNIE